MDIRISTGSAVLLGLEEARMEALPTTLYAMIGERCLGACRFCAQARDSHADPKFLSRIAWPSYPLTEVLEGLRRATRLRRVCFQTLQAPELMPALLEAVTRVREVSSLPISVCLNPVSRDDLLRLKEAGVERVGAGLDCATPETFAGIKPGFSWERYHRFIDEVVELFGRGSVHLIVGLDEADDDEALLRKVQDFHDQNCSVALFAFTPVRGARLQVPPPIVGRYRALQLARQLIVTGRATVAQLRFEGGRLVAINVEPAVVERALASGTAFRTSGCPDCNRPLYNERPGGVMYNFPAPLTEAEKAMVRAELAQYLTLVERG